MSDQDAAREHFIEAGKQSLLGDPRRVLERGLRSEDVVNRSGASQATFFRKFATKADFIDAVVAELTRTERPTSDDVKRAVGAHMSSQGDSPRHAVTSLIDEWFDALTDRNTVTTEFFARAFGRGHAVKSDYARRDELVLAAYEALFDRSDAALRRPFTARSFAVVVNALVDGLRSRSAFDPAAVTVDLVATSVLALIGSVVDTSGLHQHLDDTVEAFDTPVGIRAVPRDPRAAIIAAARTELGKRGYFMTRLDQIADNAAVPLATMQKLFPAKPHILVAALQSRVDAIREAVADDVLIGLDEIAIIDNFLLRCAQLAADETTFMDALLVAVAHDTYGEPDGLLSIKEKLNIPSIIGPVIQQGQDKGTLSLIGTPVDLAAGITNTLLMRCFTRRTVSPEVNAGFVGDLLLRGLKKD